MIISNSVALLALLFLTAFQALIHMLQSFKLLDLNNIKSNGKCFNLQQVNIADIERWYGNK